MVTPLFPQSAGASAGPSGRAPDTSPTGVPKPLFSQGEPAKKQSPDMKSPSALFESDAIPKSPTPAPEVTPAASAVPPLVFKESPKPVQGNPLFEGVESKEQILRKKLMQDIPLEVDLNWAAEALLDYMNNGYPSFSKKFEAWGKQNNDIHGMFIAQSSQWAQFEVTDTLAKAYKWMSGKRGFFDKMTGGSFDEIEQHLKAVYAEKAIYESKIVLIKNRFGTLKSQLELYTKAMELMAAEIPDYSRISGFLLPFQATMLMFPAEVELFEKLFTQEMDQVEKLLHLTIPAFKAGRACAR